MKIAAIIVSYNSEKVFRCYESIKEQVDLTIIIDNGTKDKDIISKLGKTASEENKLKVILLGENLGIAAALNKGAFYAKDNGFDWILTLDQDSEILQGSVAKIMTDFNSLEDSTKEKCAIVSYNYKRRSIDPITDTEENPEKFKKVKILITSGNIIKISVLDKIGCFNEKLFIDQVDHDLNFRLRKNGYILLQSNYYAIIHEMGTIENKRGHITSSHSPIRRYYISRNSVYILKKYFFFEPDFVLNLFIKTVLVYGILRVILFEKEKLQKLKYICIGIFDGIFNRFGKRYNP